MTQDNQTHPKPSKHADKGINISINIPLLWAYIIFAALLAAGVIRLALFVISNPR